MSLPAELLPDPFSAAFNGVRDAFFAHKGFADLTSKANFKNYVTLEQFLGSVKQGDMGNITMIQTGWRFMPKGRNSLSAELRVRFDLACLAGVNGLLVSKINALKWEACVALAASDGKFGLGDYIRDFEPVDGRDDAFGQAEFKRNNETYASIFGVILTLSLPRSLLARLFVPNP